MKKLILSFVLSLAFLSPSLYANTEVFSGTVKGKVLDENNNPVEFATATLLDSKTKQVVKGEVSNEKGEFVINKVNKGNYILSVSMVGYQRNELNQIEVDNKSAVIEKSIVLKESTQQLNDVVIVGRKEFIEQDVDKMVINPEVSITAASENVYEILRKLPGVTIDNNDNISLKGLQGVKVLIDDKPTYVSAAQLAAMLKGMQGKNVDKIEIIENPSARYDAEGNSGIINIKTKHNKAPGFNGSVNGGISVASKFGWNGGLDLNAKAGKFNLYGNYSNYNWAGINGMTASRMFTTTALQGAYQLINNDGNYSGTSHNYKVGLDYNIAKNHVVSAMLRGNSGNNAHLENNTTSFTDKYKNVDSMLVTKSTSENKWNSRTYNLNYKWDIDSLGQSLSFDVDYALFGFTSPNNQAGKYLDPNGVDLNNTIAVNTKQGNDIDIYTAKLDYILPLSKKMTLESGLKASTVNTDSRIDMVGFISQNDHFKYSENIQAAYLNARTQLKNTTIQAGLRLENTFSKGTSVATNQVNDTSYLKLFPSFFVQQKLNDKHSLNLKYSYRIGRPNYHSLNPFRWMVDPYTYNQGNPNLKPQFTHSAGLGHNFKNALMSNLSVNYTTGMFTEIIRQDDASKTVYQTMENVNNSLDISLSETVQFQPFKWWQLNGTVTGIYKSIELNSLVTEPLNRTTLVANMSNTFKLPYKIDLEVSGRYSSEQLISNIIIRPRSSVDVGLQRRILKDQGTIKVAVSDIFNKASGGAYANYGNVNIDVYNKWDSRRLNVTFNYRFGKNDFKTRANRATASTEEQNRSSK